MTHNTTLGEGRAVSCRTLVDVLRWRAETQPERLAYVFLRDGEVEAGRWTYADVAAQAGRVAALVRERCRQGDRALLIHPSGLDFIAAFLGCLCAGIVAVPVAAPRRARDLQRLKPLADDADPAVVLTTSETSRALGFAEHARWRGVPVLACDAHALTGGDDGRVDRTDDGLLSVTTAARAIAPDDLALLQ